MIFKSDDVLEISTVIGCKINCSYCPQSTLIRSYREKFPHSQPIMDFSSFINYIDKIPPKVDITFSGFAEPFLNPDCTNMIVYAHKNGHSIIINTTLAGMRQEDIPILEKCNIERFTIHLPDITGQMNLQITEEYLSVLKLISESSIENIRFIAFGIIDPRVQDLLKLSVIKGKVQSRAGNISNQVLETIKNTCELSDSDNQIDGKIYCTLGLRRRNLLKLQEMKGGVLLPNGCVVLCCNDYSIDYPLGNLSTQSYYELYTSPAYARFIDDCNNPVSHSICHKCCFAAGYSISDYAGRVFWYMKNRIFPYSDQEISE